MVFRRLTYPEVLENMLTSITGGVAAESHPFPPEGSKGTADSLPIQHLLQQPPVADVISVYGSRNGQPHLFRKNTDYHLLDDQKTFEWKKGAELPDPGTLFQVNYFPISVEPVVNDLYVGSVLRTLTESISLEVARLYSQMDVVYRSGFIDTADGRALDNVVALLGVERVKGGRAVGQVTFTRAANRTGVITIPAGTRVMTEDGNVEYETTTGVTMPENQQRIRVNVRDLEANEPLAADTLIVLPIPIVGISSVTNEAPTAISAQEESDTELRTRAKNFLHGSERSTLSSVNHAITRQGITADVDDITTDPAISPGVIRIVLHADTLPPELDARVRAAVEDARPAGVRVDWGASVPPKKINLSLRLFTADGLLEQDLRATQRDVRSKVEDYFAQLPVKSAGSINKIVGMVVNTKGVEDVQIVSAESDGTDVLDVASGKLAIEGFPTQLGEIKIADPNLPTLVQVTVRFPDDQPPPDEVAIRDSIRTAITEINNQNANDTGFGSLSYGLLRHVTPLPGQPVGTVGDFDPEATVLDTTPYIVNYIVSLENSVTVQLPPGPHDLTPFERLSLGNVIVEVDA